MNLDERRRAKCDRCSNVQGDSKHRKALTHDAGEKIVSVPLPPIIMRTATERVVDPAKHHVETKPPFLGRREKYINAMEWHDKAVLNPKRKSKIVCCL